MVKYRCVDPLAGLGRVSAAALLYLSLLQQGASLAQEQVPVPPPGPAGTAESEETIGVEATDGGDEEVVAPPKRSANRGRGREKEAEGTQAKNRFEADTVLKSRYSINGKPADVDPD